MTRYSGGNDPYEEHADGRRQRQMASGFLTSANRGVDVRPRGQDGREQAYRLPSE